MTGRESVCEKHTPDYARDGRELEPSGQPCCVCEAPSSVFLPAIIENLDLSALRSDGEWPK